MTNTERSCEYFASCPKQLESLLREELISLGVESVRETSAGVYFSANLPQLYRVCLWSRLANRILMPMAREKCASGDDVYDIAAKLPWEEYFSEHVTLIVDFIGSNDHIRHTQFGAQKLKDAIVDRFSQKCGTRPSVDKRSPDVRINAYLTKSDIVISIDVTGESLHRRGYRSAQGAAPLKENLAAALLIRAGWPAMVKKGGQPLALLDPMCGSGTLLIEAAQMAAKIAPGLMRERFGFEKLNFHNQECWLAEREEAKAAAIPADSPDLPHIEGYDIDRDVLRHAKQNIADAGLTVAIRVSQRPLHAFSLPEGLESIKQGGLLICNPPYGERLGEIDALRSDYRNLGQVAKRELAGWRLAVFTSNRELGQEMRLRPKHRYKFFNGRLPAELLICEVLGDEMRLREDAPGAPERNGDDNALGNTDTLSTGATMVSNRLIKNQKRLRKWLTQENIQCYRLYDADMPEYSAAVDVYGDFYHIQEYQAPKKVDKQKAKQRFQEIEHAVAHAFKVSKDRVFCKTRMRTKGHTQYEKQSHEGNTSYIEVKEGKAKLLVNLQDYLDTGLFLDHRPLRELIAGSVAGKRFLNLFCYTATATVHAALGGAESSVSVDLSNTYLDWARRNFELNNISKARHQLVRADCVEWLRNCRQGFDVIMLDPPTFSNSKNIDTVLDIQKDHVALVKRCMELLSPGGVLFFSNNLRSFKLDESALARYHVVNMTRESLGPDFERNPKIHSCWKIMHTEPS